ncbi:MAG: NUDIX domain-containing protein [Caldilineales bacterium]|nr:NUDIX domain-containing protein [Caldilineales bacterium]MDW8317407.1 NUDIX domain-containing protein [Anaerolineae bacterium]
MTTASASNLADLLSRGLEVRRYQAAGGVVVDDQGRVLLIERTVDGRHEVRLPKGHIDPGEAPDEAARREVCEETGFCDLEVLADLGWQEVAFEYKGRLVIRGERYYLMRLASQRRQAPQFTSEREALFRNRWEPTFDAAASALTFEAERDVVRRAQQAHSRLSTEG